MTATCCPTRLSRRTAAVKPARISVIIPALNEAGAIANTLEALQGLRRRGHEVIVVDGGSHDATALACRPLADKLIVSPRGRARQMQAGAEVAEGSVLWFLHADTLASDSPDESILGAVSQGRHQWGRFDVQFQSGHFLLKLVAMMMNLRSRFTGIATGDQGIFITRTLFDRIGGYPDLPLMEDIALSRLLKKHSRPACPRKKIFPSARRWERDGILRTILLMWTLRLGYFVSVPPGFLARFYKARQA